MEGTDKKEIGSMVGEAMTKFLKEQMGEQAETVRVQIVENAIIIRFKGILPPAERHMANDQEGLKLIKELKEKLIETTKPLLEKMIKDLTNVDVLGTYSSLDPTTDERIEIFVLNKDLEKVS